MVSLADHRLSRRSFLGALTAAGAALLLPPGRLRADQAFALPDATRAALEKSPLIYLSPLRSDGAESECHGEVWYVRDGAELLVVTAADRWKALAVRRGLDRARIWVGDFGQWKKSRRALQDGAHLPGEGPLRRGRLGDRSGTRGLRRQVSGRVG